MLKGRSPLVVAGTHGKTTTSAMCAWLLHETGRDPGFLIGVLPKNFEHSFRLPAEPAHRLEDPVAEGRLRGHQPAAEHHGVRVEQVHEQREERPERISGLGEDLLETGFGEQVQRGAAHAEPLTAGFDLVL